MSLESKIPQTNTHTVVDLCVSFSLEIIEGEPSICSGP